MCLTISRMGNKIASFNLKHIRPDPRSAITRFGINAFFCADMSMKFGSNQPIRQSCQVKPEMLQPAKVTKRLVTRFARGFKNVCSHAPTFSQSVFV
jgi:hypothetical protein